jgi:pimeloyl-ACP methyl ester carboxylesterase
MPFTCMILTSAPARPVGVVAHEQIERQLKSLPGGDELLAAYDAAIDEFVLGRSVSVDANLPEFLRTTIQGISNPINQPFARELWLADPALQLGKIKVPVLILIGKKDIQVNWQADGAIFEKIAREHTNISVKFAESANHVLKYEPRDREELNAAEVGNSYNAEERVLDHDVVEIIRDWLKNN